MSAIFATLTFTSCGSESSTTDEWPTTNIIEVSTSEETSTTQIVSDKIALVNLWALWCAPCREELPRLQNVAEQYGDQISVLGINIGDDFGKTTDYINEAGLTFPMYWDETGDLLTALEIPSVPATLAVDSNGNITWFHLGALSEQDLRAEVNQLVNS